MVLAVPRSAMARISLFCWVAWIWLLILMLSDQLERGASGRESPRATQLHEGGAITPHELDQLKARALT
jgi:hypothetical protein